VRCYQVTGGQGDTVAVVGIPGIPVPLALPVPIVVPVVSDTGDSGSTDVDQRVTVYVDIDNQNVVDGDAYARRGQRALATLLLLVGLPALAILMVVLLRRRSGGGPAAPAGPGGWPTPPGGGGWPAPPGSGGSPQGPPPVPGPGGTWVYYPPGATPPGVPSPEPPPPDGPEEGSPT
jgi:hypothetical protein